MAIAPSTPWPQSSPRFNEVNYASVRSRFLKDRELFNGALWGPQIAQSGCVTMDDMGKAFARLGCALRRKQKFNADELEKQRLSNNAPRFKPQEIVRNFNER